MRMTFDDSSDESLFRSWGRKRVGRKHNHQPRGRAREKRRLTAMRNQDLENERRRHRNKIIAAYWNGELDAHPCP